MSPRFTIGQNDFLLDGRPFRILAGALHYFRVHPDQWRHRIRMARLMGLNTIETYIPWNEHARRPGTFDLEGRLDLGRFLDEVAAAGMFAIVRPGPYICAEWDNGGLPAWLFVDPEMRPRSSEASFTSAVTEYFEHLASVLVPRQLHENGPIILVQIENEYGAFGSDKEYLKELVRINRAIGLTVPLTTVDQPTDRMLANGGLPDLHKTGSFGGRVLERLATLRRHQPTGPLMCSEFWNGWFDYWGSHHHVTAAGAAAQELEHLLAEGASVNLYMFHGGANFGFTNGANHKGIYRPTVTSYDYDAPLDEAGVPTEKYWAFREVISRYAPVPDEKPAEHFPPLDLSVEFSGYAPLSEALPGIARWSSHDSLPSMDDLGHYRGFALYETDIVVDDAAVLEIPEVRDRCQVFIDWRPVGVLAREEHDHALVLPGPVRGTLQLLVEDQGRVNYGALIGERKGLVGEVRLAGEALTVWRVAVLELDDISELSRTLRGRADGAALPRVIGGPSFARAEFDVEEPAEDLWFADRYVSTSGLGKGVAWLNGFCLGRYWSKGPQRTLLVPGPLLQETGNELLIFEQVAAARGTVITGRADRGHTEM